MTITFILGGARSGKSTYAMELAKKISHNVAYVATCNYRDEEMDARIAKHQADRPAHWATIEEFNDLSAPLLHHANKFDVLLIDCLTLFISGLMLADQSDTIILDGIEKFLSTAQEIPGQLLIVANEVGLGIVPEHPLGRRFRDLAGIINQKVARVADEVFLMTAGIPMKIK